MNYCVFRWFLAPCRSLVRRILSSDDLFLVIIWTTWVSPTLTWYDETLLLYELLRSAQYKFLMHFFSYFSMTGNASEATVHAQGSATDEQVDDVRTCWRCGWPDGQEVYSRQSPTCAYRRFVLRTTLSSLLAPCVFFVCFTRQSTFTKNLLSNFKTKFVS